MNMTNDGSHYGFTQYRWPLDYELAGQVLRLYSGTAEYQLCFQDREFIECNGVLSQYEALKLGDDTHVVFFGETITTAVLCLKSGTAVISAGVDGAYDFCRIMGTDADSPLPAYTDEMTDTHVRWYFGNDRYLEHRYLADGKCESIWSPRTDRLRTIPACYIRLSEAMYLVELNHTAPFRTDMPQGFSKTVLVQDYNRLLTVGCIYNPLLNEFRLISGYAMEP